MKNSILTLLIFVVFPQFAQSQQLKKRTKVLNPSTTEEYYVLKTDKKIKHGLYRKTSTFNHKTEEGYYKMGKRDSLWKTTYKGTIHKIGSFKDDQQHGIWLTYGNIDSGRPILRDSGAYELGNKVGIWKYYDRDGEPELIYDYDKKAKIFQKQDTMQHLIVLGKDTLASTLDQSPIYLDGWDDFYYTVAHNFRLKQGIYKKTEGLKTKIYISFFINEAGDMEEVKAISKSDEELNKQAISAILATRKSKWIPGIYQGKLVKTQIIIPFNFTNLGMVRN